MSVQEGKIPWEIKKIGQKKRFSNKIARANRFKKLKNRFKSPITKFLCTLTIMPITLYVYGKC